MRKGETGDWWRLAEVDVPPSKICLKTRLQRRFIHNSRRIFELLTLQAQQAFARESPMNIVVEVAGQ
jgi:hypothetical protein